MKLVCKKGFSEAELMTSCIDAHAENGYQCNEKCKCLCMKCEYHQQANERCTYDCLDEIAEGLL